MYSEHKKEEQEILQTSGKEKSDKESKASIVIMEPAPEEKKPTHRSSKKKLQFKATKGQRWYYQTKSKKL